MKPNTATNVTLTLRSAAAPGTQPTWITYSEVMDMLMEEGGMRYREAQALLQRNQPPPIPHKLHSRRRWSRSQVHAFCRKLINPES